MSCTNCNCNPCTCSCSCDPQNEALSSAFLNFMNSAVGPITKTCVNGQVVWSYPCGLDAGDPAFPRLAGESLFCYFLRYLIFVNAATGGGAALLRSLNLSDLTNVAAARANLGLGSAAVQPVGNFLQVANDLNDVSNIVTARTNLGLDTAAVHAIAFFLQTANNLSDVVPATARTNLGLGTIAVENAPLQLSKAGLGASGIPLALTPGANVTLDFSLSDTQTLAIAQNTTFATAGRSAGLCIALHLSPDASNRNMTFPAGWQWITAVPASITASKYATLSLQCTTGLDTGVRAAYKEQP